MEMPELSFLKNTIRKIHKAQSKVESSTAIADVNLFDK